VIPRKRSELGTALAAAFLAGAWTERSMATRGAAALDPRPRWLRRVAREVLGAYHRPPLDRPRELGRFIAVVLERLDPPGAVPSVRRMFVFDQAMGRMRWPVPPIASVGELAERFELSVGQLEWLADVRGLERTVSGARLRNYNYDWRPRSHGTPRLIERPKRRLKEAQRGLLHDVLERIPPHDAAHGFVGGRSAVTNARSHVGRRVVMRFDLEDFFASVRAGRVYGLFRLAGYPEGVAHAMTGLCTNVVPASVWRSGGVVDGALGRRLATPHLPQGAPTSPALANLCAFVLDRRLSGLASAFGAAYTRYADDLTFSGGRLLLDAAPTVREVVARVVREEGFVLRADKSSLVTRAGRQRVCGIVVNAHPNVSRVEHDRLRALLHEARVRGPVAANRLGRDEFRAHVLGRIAWVTSLNPRRGARLRRQYDLVAWD
jgi:RNA-directed DNA polymerase